MKVIFAKRGFESHYTEITMTNSDTIAALRGKIATTYPSADQFIIYHNDTECAANMALVENELYVYEYVVESKPSTPTSRSNTILSKCKVVSTETLFGCTLSTVTIEEDTLSTCGTCLLYTSPSPRD